MRLRGTDVKTMEEEGLDTDGAVESKSKLRGKIKALSGVDILTDTGAYKSTYEILKEISDVWEDIGDQDQAALLELLAGKRAGSVMSAILQNPDILKNAFEDANNAAGSALKENEKYLNSIQGRIDLFTNAVQTMWSNTLDSNVIKWFVDLGTKIVKIIDDLGLFKIAFSGLITFITTKYLGINWAQPIQSFKTLFGKKSADDIKLVEKNLQSLEKEYESAKVAFAADPSTKNKKTLTETQSRLEEYKSINQSTTDFQNNISKAQAKLDKAQNRLNNYAGNNQDTIRKYKSEVKKAQANVDALNQSQINTNKNGSVAWTNLGEKATQFAQKIQSAITSMFVMYAISKIIQGIEYIFDKAIETYEESNQSFEELNSELSNTKSELQDLESQLKNVNDQIEEIKSNSPLTFTDQEELSRLKAQSDELQRQIDLTNVLKEQQQYKVNESAINAANKYAQTGVKTGKTASENAASKAGTGAGIGAGIGVATGVGGAILTATGLTATGGAMAAGTTLGAFAGPIGMLIGAAIGAIVGAAIGAAVGGIESASEETVGESLDNMKEQYTKLQEEYDTARQEYQSDPSKKNKKKFEEAEEAFNSYKSNMATYMSEMNQYYSQIKQNWDVATDAQKKEYTEWADKMDMWAIENNSPNAKSNAITRIFGDEATDDIKQLEVAVKNAINPDTDFSFEDILNNESFHGIMARLNKIGIGLGDLKYYFIDVKKAEDDALENISTYDAVKEINTLTDGVNSLKDAYKELKETGIVSAKTIVDLQALFGKTDAWDKFVTAASRGTTSLKEFNKIASEMAKEYIDNILSSGNYNKDDKLTYINNLRSLGVQNPSEYIDKKIEENMYKEIEAADINWEAYFDGRYRSSGDERQKVQDIIDKYGLDAENDELKENLKLIAEKQSAEEELIDLQKKRNEYASWEQDNLNNIAAAKDKYEALKKDAEKLKDFESFNPDDWRWGGRTGYYHNGSQVMSPTKYGKYKLMYEQLEAAKTEYEKLLNDDSEAPELVTDEQIANAEKKIKELESKLESDSIQLEVEFIKTSELVDEVQDVFDTLVNAQKEYNENGGYVTVDTMQSLLELGPKYLAMLYDEHGQITLNKDALYQVAQARLYDMTQKQIDSIITTATNAAKAGEIDKLNELTSTLYEATDAQSAFNTSALQGLRIALSDESLGLSLTEQESYYNSILDQVNAVIGLYNTTVANMPNALSTTTNTIEDDVNDAFQKAMDYWENRISANQAKYEQIQNEIDLIEKQGGRVGKEYYEEQIRLENERLWLLEQQKAAAQEYLGNFDEGSDEWWEIANTLNDLESEIDDVVSSLQDLSDAIAEIDLYIFEETHNRFQNLIGDLETIRDLIAQNGEEDWFDEEGMWTEKGVAVLGTYIQQYEMYKNALQGVNEELAKYQKEYVGNEEYYAQLGINSEQELYDKQRELIDQQYEYAQAINDTENSVKDAYSAQIDAIEEWADEAIDAYNDYIDVVKESLSAERDLYEFKKSTNEKTKNIASLERRIASLSASDNASDIAERRKLQAELADAKMDLEDHYYSHAKDQQSQALDDEAQAYEESLNNYVEKLRDTLDEATSNMELFMQSVTNSVMLNADTVKNEYINTGVVLDEALVSPWNKAIEQMKGFEKDGLSMMNAWTTEEGFFGKFETNATEQLESPWSAGTDAANAFKNDVKSAMKEVVRQVKRNVAKAKKSLSSLYQDIQDTDIGGSGNGGNGGSGGNGGNDLGDEKVKAIQRYLNEYFNAELKIDGKYGSATTAAVKAVQKLIGVSQNGRWNNETVQAIPDYCDYMIAHTMQGYRQGDLSNSQKSEYLKKYQNAKSSIPAAYYAKGTLGTKKDQWAITDEPQFGDELTMYATPEGTLSYMRVGSTVTPAALTKEIMDIANVGLDGLMNANKIGANVNIISNAINKPELNFNVEKFLSIDKVDEGCLPEVKKFVQQELDSFVRKLNYSLKGIGAR